MELLNVVRDNWLDLLQTLSLLAGFFFTERSYRKEMRQRRVTNENEMTKSHREISMLRFSHPELSRIDEVSVDLNVNPPTKLEEWFVRFHILHLANHYRASKKGLSAMPEEIAADLANFFSRPIPRKVWEKIRRFQNDDFIRFVEKAFHPNESRREQRSD